MGEAVRSGDVLFVVVPAFAHEWIAEQVAPHLQDGQIIVLTPGYFGGTLVFRKIFQERGVDAKVTLAEVPSLPYATRIIGPAQVGIKGIKKRLLLAALPATETDRVLQPIEDGFAWAGAHRQCAGCRIGQPQSTQPCTRLFIESGPYRGRYAQWSFRLA